mmetsp:Transcript_14724/g.16292  ORF Transcript_14724/g.16292 Transcript_14724/m.16292 type:complete len:84 (-) Transcript_14724:546-797(-)
MLIVFSVLAPSRKKEKKENKHQIMKSRQLKEAYEDRRFLKTNVLVGNDNIKRDRRIPSMDESAAESFVSNSQRNELGREQSLS